MNLLSVGLRHARMSPLEHLPVRGLMGMFDVPSWQDVYQQGWQTGTGPMLDETDLYKTQCPEGYTWDQAQHGCVDPNAGPAEVTCPKGMVRNTDPSKGPIGCVPVEGKPKGLEAGDLVLIGAGVIALACAGILIYNSTQH